MSTKIGGILKSLSKRDVGALKSVYDFRCLTVAQIYQLHYMKSIKFDNDIVSDSYCKKKIYEFTELGILEKVEYPEGEALFLTTLGIEVVKNAFDFPMNIYDYEKKIVKRGYYRASELRVAPKYISHQLMLNQFMIDFIAREHDVYWKYYDEKHISQFRNIRPDGLLNMLDIDFFLEMDMATESKKQLYNKWENYRRFLDSKEYDNIERKIVVLFIVENTMNPQARIDLIRHTIGERLMDRIDANFEIYVDTMDGMMNLLEDKIGVAKKLKMDENDEIFRSIANQGFSVAMGEKLRDIFGGFEFDFYGRKIDENNHIIVEYGKVQEFVVDSYKHSPFSVLKKVAFINLVNLHFKKRFKREVSYVVVAESEEQIYRDLKVMDLLVVNNIFYTTFERMNTRPIHKALFQFDFLGNLYSFVDSGLDERVFEHNIPERMTTSE